MEAIVWESVWVAVGFVVFVALVWKRLGNVLNTMLDDRSPDQGRPRRARTLREEALDELHQFQRLHREAAEEAKAILKNAEATAERIRENAEAQPRKRSSAASSRRRQDQAAETAMINELREKAQACRCLGSADHYLEARRQGRTGTRRRSRWRNRETELGRAPCGAPLLHFFPEMLLRKRRKKAENQPVASATVILYSATG